MKKVRLVTGILALMSIPALGACYAQSAAPKGESPAKTPTSVREQVERLQSFDPVERRQAAQELGRMGEGAVAAVPFLIKSLNDNARLVVRDPEGEASSSSVAEAAMMALVEIGPPAVDSLILSLGDSNPGVRMMATEALGRIQDPKTIEPLIGVLESDGDALVQAAAVDALRRKRDPKALEALVLAEQSESWMVRSLAKSAVEEARTEAGDVGLSPSGEIRSGPEDQPLPQEEIDAVDSGEAHGTVSREVTPEPEASAPAAPEEEPTWSGIAGKGSHIVERGDTLYSIGRRYGVPWQTLMELNDLYDPTELFVGQTLKIQAPSEERGPPREAAETEKVAGGETTYTVQQGDTLYRIGQRYGVAWQRLMTYNNMYDPADLYAGQELKIPEGARVTAPLAWDGVTTYTVQDGDILYEIGLLFGMSWREIAALNGIAEPNEIFVGQVLKIPGRGKALSP
jgi:LysM repeat protein